MKYTRVRAVTCALTASVMIFGSAAHTNAAGVSHDLPAAGVALVLEEGSSLSGAQEDAGQSGQASQESTGDSQEASADASTVTSEDIEAGATGVGEAAIDTQVVEHVEDQQVEQVIDSGVGVASVLSTDMPETAPAASEAVPAASGAVQMAAGSEISLTAGVEAAVNAVPSAEAQAAGPEPLPPVTNGIVVPVDVAAAAAAVESSSDAAGGEEQDNRHPAKEQPEASASEEKQEEEQSSENEAEPSEEASENEAGSSGEEQVSESEEESSAEQPSESEAESSEEEQPSESEAESSEEQPSESEEESSDEEQASESGAESSSEEQSSESETAPSGQLPSEEESAAAESTPADGGEQQAAEEDAASETEAQTDSVEPASPEASHTEVSSTGSTVAEFALQFVGNPYVYGGTSLTNGADCSGFVMSVYENFGVSLPHSSSADRNVGTEVAGGLSNAQAGDIVCYSGHVGIYIGNGQIVHASTEETGIKVSDADYRTPITVRRIFN